jgi:hypothetical protein
MGLFVLLYYYRSCLYTSLYKAHLNTRHLHLQNTAEPNALIGQLIRARRRDVKPTDFTLYPL